LAYRNQNKTIMNHIEAIQEIIKVAPESEEEFKEPYKTKNPFMVINVFTRQIRKRIYKRDHKSIIGCLHKMNELYKKGDQALKNAVESVFIYSLDSLTMRCDTAYRNLIFSNRKLL